MKNFLIVVFMAFVIGFIYNSIRNDIENGQNEVDACGITEEDAMKMDSIMQTESDSLHF